MKNLIAFVSLCCLFFSCKKENAAKNEPYANSLIVGTWFLNKDSLLDYDKNNKLTRVVSVMNFPTKNAGFYKQFNSDGTVVINNGDDAPQSGVFELTGSAISIITPPYTVSGPGGTYSVFGISESGNVKLLTANNLLIQFDSYEFGNGDTTRVTERAYFNK